MKTEISFLGTRGEDAGESGGAGFGEVCTGGF